MTLLIPKGKTAETDGTRISDFDICKKIDWHLQETMLASIAVRPVLFSAGHILCGFVVTAEATEALSTCSAELAGRVDFALVTRSGEGFV